MRDADRFIESGILELHLLGCATPGESAEVEEMAALYPAVRRELNLISRSLEQYARLHAVEPDPTIRPFLMATIAYTERMKNGEAPTFPPMLHPDSTINDFAPWLQRKDLGLPGELIDFQAHIIGYTPEAITAIVWLKDGAPAETHTNQLEKFLVVEGSCAITVGNDVHEMNPGDVLIIPLHVSHHVQVTSSIPCKVILQRVAA